MKRFFVIIGFLVFCPSVHAQDVGAPVEISGDQVQYSTTENKVVASGNVVVKSSGVTLSCERLEFDRGQNVGIAEGSVVLERNKEKLTGDRLIYNFNTMKGDFLEAKVTSSPFYGAGQKIIKGADNHIILHNGYITTCDHDKPHFRFKAPRVDIYPGDKAVARNMTMMIGNVPVLYLPRYTQDLRDKKPMFTLTPGYSKDWGSFALAGWRHRWNENVNTVLHLDYRSKRGLAEGADINYKTSDYGKGFMKLYYTHERFKDYTKFFYDYNNNNDKPAIEKERFKVEWRHSWDIDKRTKLVGQYYKLKDDQFLKDFFEEEYQDDSNPPTYLLLTRGLSTVGTLSFRADARVNRFTSAVERLPEINYLMPGQQIGASRFYWKNDTTYSNLTKLEPSPSAHRYETHRVDTDNEISYPLKIQIFEFRPFVGGEQTYYSKALEKQDNDTVRGIFKTGADLSTKFFKVYDVKTNWMKMDINRLRHVMTPSIKYFYTHDPSIESSKLVQFDGKDDLAQQHGMTFGFENKLQTKRAKQSQDLVRFLVTSDFYLKEDENKGGFNNIVTKTDIIPNRYVTFYGDTYYDTIERRIETTNFDVYFNDPQNKWSLGLGKRYDREVDDQITAQLNYRLNQKWYVEFYQRWDIDAGIDKEQQYSIVRDLHEWEARTSFNHKDTDGDSIWMVFTLKEFSDLGLNFGTGFNRRKVGAR